MAQMFTLGFQINTTPLQQAVTAANAAASSFQNMGNAAAGAQAAASGAAQASGNAGRSYTDLQQRIQALTGQIRLNQADLQGLVALLRGQTGLVGGVDAASGAIAQMATRLGPLGLALGGAAVAVGAVAVAFNSIVKPLAEAQDKMALFEGRMKNALGSASAATETMEALYKATQRTGLGFRETADSFLRLARNGEALGASREQLMQLTDTVQKLGAVSGASRGEIGSGMLQLSQALASGKLNGDELRSIMENMPALAKAIADGLGVGVGQMRAMGAAGELTGNKVFEAILKSADKANKEFASLPDTVERASQRSSDAWDRLLATLGERWNASGFVKGATNFMTDLVNKANQALKAKSLQDRITEAEANVRGFESLPETTTEGRRQRNSLGAQAARRELEALRQKAREEADAAAAAAKEEEQKQFLAPIRGASALGSNEYDDFEKKRKKATEDALRLQDALDRINIRTKSGIVTDEEKALLPSLTRQLSIARAEVDGLIVGLDKVRKEASDSRRAADIGGGGGGTGIVQQALQQLQSARDKLGNGAGALNQYIAAGIDQAVIKGEEQIKALERQAESQTRLQATVGKSRAEIREFEIANEVAQKRIDMFGKLSAPQIEAFMKRYTDALRRSKEAADEFANAQARAALQIQIDNARENLGAVGAGGYDQRRLANSQQARETAKRDPQQAEMQRSLFGVQESITASTQLDSIRRNVEANRRLSDPLLSPGETREIELQRRISDAQRNVAPQFRQELGQAMKDEDESQRTKEYAAQEAALLRQGRALRERQSLDKLPAEEYRVQLRLLEKRQQLEAAGAPSEVVARQLQITEQLERQTIEYEKQKRIMDTFPGAFGKAIDSVGDALKSGIETSLQSGTRAGLKAFSDQFRAAIRKMGAEITYEIGIRPFIEAIKNMAIAFGQKLAGMFLGGGGGGGFGSASGGGVMALGGAFEREARVYALGGVFGPSAAQHTTLFANGGAFTNAVVDKPTMFAFAKGRALGLMGEAGPEAIMPLKRASDGSLGVRVADGGPNAVVPIKRGSDGSLGIASPKRRGVMDEMARGVREFAQGGIFGAMPAYAFAGGAVFQEGSSELKPTRKAREESGGDVSVVINDMRQNRDSQKIEVAESKGPDNRRVIQIMVRDEVRRAVRSGELDADMQSTYGLSRSVARK